MFFARVLINVTPDLVDRLLATRSNETSTSTNEPISTAAEPQVRSKDKTSPDLSKPPPSIDDQPRMAIEESDLSYPIESDSSDEASETEVDDILHLQSI